MEISKEYPIEIHFKQKEANGEWAVPIYELGESLIALQRMVIQAYLIAEEDERTRDKKRVIENTAEVNMIPKSIHQKDKREALSLRLVERKVGSDAYAFDWYSLAPIILPHVLNAALKLIFEAGTVFASNTVIHNGKLHRAASLMFNEFLVLSNRIQKVGNIDTIEVYVQGRKKPFVIDHNVKAYVGKIQRRLARGEKTTLKAKVAAAYIMSHDYVDVYPEENRRRIKVDVTHTEDFDKILRRSAREHKTPFEFEGYPMLRPGDDENNYREFRALKVIPPPSPKKIAKKKTAKAAGKTPLKKNKKKATKPRIAKARGGAVKKRGK